MCDPGGVPGRYLPEVIAKFAIFEGAVFPPKHSTHRANSEVEIGLGSWIFDFLSRSMGAMFWGEYGPFEDGKFRR
jgi:hypothetical protein